MNIAEIQERCKQDAKICEEATPGPWHVRLTDDDFYMNATYVGTEPDTGFTGHDGLCGMGGDAEPRKVVAIVLLQQPRLACIADGKWDENAAFITHARTALEQSVTDRLALIEELEAADRAIEAHLKARTCAEDMLYAQREDATAEIGRLREALTYIAGVEGNELDNWIEGLFNAMEHGDDEMYQDHLLEDTVR